MSGTRAPWQPQIRAALTVHAAAVMLTAAAVLAFGVLDSSSVVPVSIRLVCCAIILACSSFALVRVLSGTFYWDHVLSSLQDCSFDPFALPLCHKSTPSAHSWNRIVEQGRRWQSLTELQKSTALQLKDRRGSDLLPIVNALAGGMAAVDGAGKITLANSVFLSMCGVDSVADVTGKSLSEALGADADASRQLDGPLSQQQLSLEVQLATQDGPPRLLRCTRRPQFSESMEVVGHVWTARDVTQQRLADSMRDKFLSAATHELRTPLANIRAYSESLDMSDDIDLESRKRFYNIIQSESVRLSQLIDNLLDISRMQAGAMALDRHETDLGRLAEEASAKVAAQMQEKQIQFRCEFPPKIPKASIDKQKLMAAIVNLLGNAAKYTPVGGKVTFGVEIRANEVLFVVTDTGIGIATDELPRVFERFYRSADDRVREITGSGLGLALSQEVARLHGGDIAVESTIDVGSTFRLSIPLEAAG